MNLNTSQNSPFSSFSEYDDDFFWNNYSGTSQEERATSGFLPEGLTPASVDQLPSSAPFVQQAHQIGMQSLQAMPSQSTPLFISLEGFISLAPQFTTPSLPFNSYLNVPSSLSGEQEQSAVASFNPFFFETPPQQTEQPVMTGKQEEAEHADLDEAVSPFPSSKKRRRSRSQEDKIKVQTEEQEQKKVIDLQKVKQKRRREKNRISAQLSRDRKKEIEAKQLSELKEFDSMVKRIDAKCARFSHSFSSMDDLTSQAEETRSKKITVEEIDRRVQRERIEKIVDHALDQIQVQERRAIQAETELSLAQKEMARLQREIQSLRMAASYNPQANASSPLTLMPSTTFSFL